MSSNRTPQPRHHRAVNFMDTLYGSEFQENKLETNHDSPYASHEAVPDTKICEVMQLIQKKDTQRQLSQQTQKLNTRKKILNLYQNSKNAKPIMKLLKIPDYKSKAKKEKLFVPILSSRRTGRSPLANPRLTQKSKTSDSSNKSMKSHTESLSLTPLSSKRFPYPEINYLV